MTRRQFAFALTLLILLGIAIGLIIYLGRRHERIKELTLYGNVDVRQVDIGFRVAGQVEQLQFWEGDVVEEGQLMASLDDSPYDALLAQAEANVSSIRATLDNAERLLQRRQELIGIGGVSQEDLQDQLANRDQLAANLAAAEAALAVARDNLNYTQAYSPTRGVILTRIREPGTVVNPADPVYTLSVASPIWVRAYVDEPQLGLVCYGQEAKVLTDAGRSYVGRVGFISPVSEFTPKTVQTTQLRTDLVYRLRIYVDDPDWGLKQGMPVTVKLQVEDQCHARQ